jgi:hypothetical protein
VKRGDIRIERSSFQELQGIDAQGVKDARRYESDSKNPSEKCRFTNAKAQSRKGFRLKPGKKGPSSIELEALCSFSPKTWRLCVLALKNFG